MATKSSKKSSTKYSGGPRATKRDSTRKSKFNYCIQPEVKERAFDREIHADRARLIRSLDRKWANGTRLHYYFFTSPGSLSGSSGERDIVRQAFDEWKNVGIGLEFAEVDSIDEAEIRIGFLRGDGAWSYMGRDILDQGQTARTMNFGWNISNDIDTAIHEIGHTLGFPHEHQNPNAGIVWDEEKVYDALAQPPNSWSRDTTYWNIIRKLPQSEVEGSGWDKDSIMHYPFEAGLILQPEEFRTTDLVPGPGLSARDREWVRSLYPPLTDNDYDVLVPYRSVQATLDPGEQLNFYVRPSATRVYNFATFGSSDTVMVLFEEVDGEPRYLTGDDDSGYSLNASFDHKLFAGRTYILRVRLYWQHREGDFGVMTW
ncbi:MAG: M12 family metallopeptidase [Xanthomonadales bacterium]|nr:M12 family metallopeptidase [Xanthomonadales bacterium]